MSREKLFLVEDESMVAWDIKVRAENLNYTVVGIASNGKDAIEKVKKHQPNLILMDILLEGDMTGIEAAKQINSENDIPIVYLTAYSDKKILKEAKLTNPFGYIIKPITDKDLYTAIEIALHMHAMDSKIKMSEKRYRSLFELSNPILLINKEGDMVFMNEKVEKVLDRNRDSLIGKSITTLKEYIDDDIDKFMDKIVDLQENESLGPFEIKVKNKSEVIYFEIYGSKIVDDIAGNDDEVIQIMAHNITPNIEAEKSKAELAQEKALSQLYKFIVSAVPIFASSVPVQLRNTFIKSFGDKFEDNLKPDFINMMKNEDNSLDGYIKWIDGFLSSLGMETKITKNKSKISIEFLTFPWAEEAEKNPILSLMFRTMLIRSFTWTGIKGNINQTSKLTKHSNMCFDIHTSKNS